MNPIGLFIIAAGVFSIVGAWADWDWFMNNYKARFMIKAFGRTGARIFYVVLGLVITVLGILIAVGMIEDNSQSVGPDLSVEPTVAQIQVLPQGGCANIL